MSSRPEPAQPATWQEQTAKTWWDTKIADQLIQMAKDLQRQTLVSRLVRMTQNKGFGLELDEGPEDEMGVHLGNIIYEQHEAKPPAPEPPTAAAQPQAQPRADNQPRPLSFAGKAAVAAIAAGVGSLGLGLPIAGAMALPAVLEFFSAPTRDTDTDTNYEYISPLDDQK